jgi:16S rRNA (guanine(966)-N(2))-methyltransferase RsmD
MIKIQSGKFKGHLINVPSSARPTSSKIRSSLINIVSGWFADAVVLDLFAGSGSFGLEALSRGAKKAIFIDSSPQAQTCIKANIQKLGVKDQAICIKSLVEKSKEKISLLGPFDIVFADPPYAQTIWNAKLFTLIDWQQFLAHDGIIILEASKRDWVESETFSKLPWADFQTREYAETVLVFCTRKKDTHS